MLFDTFPTERVLAVDVGITRRFVAYGAFFGARETGVEAVFHGVGRGGGSDSWHNTWAAIGTSRIFESSLTQATRNIPVNIKDSSAGVIHLFVLPRKILYVICANGLKL